jgi:hypothetical protein
MTQLHGQPLSKVVVTILFAIGENIHAVAVQFQQKGASEVTNFTK